MTDADMHAVLNKDSFLTFWGPLFIWEQWTPYRGPQRDPASGLVGALPLESRKLFKKRLLQLEAASGRRQEAAVTLLYRPRCWTLFKMLDTCAILE